MVTHLNSVTVTVTSLTTMLSHINKALLAEYQLLFHMTHDRDGKNVCLVTQSHGT